MNDIALDIDLSAIWVLIDDVQPNTWNPNQQTDFIYEKTVISILEKGFVDAVKVREIAEDKYELIDGEHRWKAAKELLPQIIQKGDGWIIPWKYMYEGAEQERHYPVRKEWAEGKLPVVNLGKLSDATARELTVILNSTRGEADTLKLAEVIRELEELVGSDQCERLLPFTSEEQASMLDLLDFDWSQFEGSTVVDDIGEPQEEWVSYLFSIPPDAIDAIDDEIKRIGDILKVNPRLPKEMRWGLILEKICVLSAQTPTESLE